MKALRLLVFESALVLLLLASFVMASGAYAADAPRFQLATFSVDVTIPLNHRCMGVLPTKSKKIVDPLYAHGFVLLGGEKPIVQCAVDWCEIRNGAYDQWRDALAQAAGTTRERVLVSSLHQHDAPVTDAGAAQLLTSVGLTGELYDEAFHDEAVERIATALRNSLEDAQPVTHFGTGQARVKDVASNRRVVYPDGRVSFGRGSRSGGNEFYSGTAEGLIDPFLKTISLWNGDKPLVALHSYATHPMSYYGRGEVTSDFVGLARERRQRDDFSVKQIYVSGCSGDVTAGKYNNGTHETRLILVDRMYKAMVAAWENTKRVPLEQVHFRNTTFELDYHPSPRLTTEALTASLQDEEQTVEKRILAAMSLSSRQRVAARQPIDLPVVDFGPAQIVLFPGEAFVGYQLMAQQMRPDSFVFSIGYGECWPGYIPTKSAFDDNFGDSWLWVAPGSEAKMRTALEQVLLAK
ncbi:MAG: hypothetical protein H8E66_21875 [Planctomycetes bacterium]|nr:hypothetical protein [Planctomycetota bacterium]